LRLGEHDRTPSGGLTGPSFVRRPIQRGSFVTTPWLPDDAVQCRRQLQLTDALTGHLLARGLVDREGLICPLLNISAGIDRGKGELRRIAQLTRTAGAIPADGARLGRISDGLR
jgi:hypothetical protein